MIHGSNLCHSLTQVIHSLYHLFLTILLFTICLTSRQKKTKLISTSRHLYWFHKRGSVQSEISGIDSFYHLFLTIPLFPICSDFLKKKLISACTRLYQFHKREHHSCEISWVSVVLRDCRHSVGSNFQSAIQIGGDC